MKMIPLTQGQVALVDDEDYERVSQRVWFADKDRNTYYAMTWVNGPSRRKRLPLQNFILDTDNLIDHADGNGLNNTRRNLRFANLSQNAANCRLRRSNSSGFRGVHKQKKRYVAGIQHSKSGTRKYLGRFDTAEEAARAYDAAAREIHGEFAVVNFPTESERQLEPVTVERCLYRIDELEKQLSSRDTEIREVLGNLRTTTDCWCLQPCIAEPVHSPACLAARALWEKVQN